MARYDQYHPDYQKIYPGIEKRPDVLAVLRSGDRKRKYIEVDLKSERFIQDQSAKTAVFMPSREDSYERLCEEEHVQFVDSEVVPEEQLLREANILLVRAVLLELEPEERALIRALFYEEMTERQCAEELKISQKGVNKRKKKVLEKLRTLLLEKNF